MMNTPPERDRQGDAHIDRLLSSRPVRATDDFSDRVRERIRAGDAAEPVLDWIEAELAHHPVKAGPEFDQRLRRKLAIERTEGAALIRFPRWLVPLTTVAALCLLSFAGLKRLQTPIDISAPSTTATPRSGEMSFDVDSEAAMLLILAGGLSEESRPLLDEANLDAIAALIQ